MAETRFMRACNMAMADAMAADPAVVLFGEDVAKPGGPFGVTKGLLDRFGPTRVFDTPISEASIMGMAVGAALSGLKPVVEIMFMDFMALCLDQLVNQAAKVHYMFGGQISVPLTVRTAHGGGISAGPQHSQCLEAWLTHIPGLKVVCPATPADTYGLLRAAINDPDPVIFIENRALYAQKMDMPDNPSIGEIGKARTARAGRDLTIVSYGATVMTCEAAAKTLASDGIEAEIIDLRSLQPWDEKAVLASLARTHRLVVAHEAVEAFGIGAEISARMADVGFDELDAPIVRVGAPFMPVPFTPSLEKSYIPDAGAIVNAARRVLE